MLTFIKSSKVTIRKVRIQSFPIRGFHKMEEGDCKLPHGNVHDEHRVVVFRTTKVFMALD